MLNWQKPDTWSILIVDDEPDNLEVVTLYLNFLGCVVKTARNGMEGLEALGGFHPNLLLIDLSMPQMDGWEMRAKLPEASTHQHFITIALTAHALPSDKDRVRAAGFDGYLSKPINLPTLISDLQNSIFTTEHAQEHDHATS